MVEVIADFGLVVPKEAFAGIAGPDPALLAGAADKFQHFAELRVGHAQRRIVLGPAHGENRKEPPMCNALGNQHVAERFELRHHGARDAGHHVVGQRGFADDHAQGRQRAVVTAGIAADMVVFAFEAVETDRNAAQSGVEQASQARFGQGHAVGDHAPRIAAAGDFGSGTLQIVAHQHLAARKDNQHLGGIDMGRDLLVEHLQEVFERHVGHTGVHAAVAAAVTARKVAAQRTLPKERREPVLGDRRSVEIGKDIEGQPFAQARTAARHGLFLRSLGALLRVHDGRILGRFLRNGIQLLRFGGLHLRIGNMHARSRSGLSRRTHAVHDDNAGRHLHRVLNLLRSGLLLLFLCALRRSVFDRRAGSRKAKQRSQSEFQFFIHIASSLRSLLQSKDKKISTEPEKNMPKSFESQ